RRHRRASVGGTANPVPTIAEPECLFASSLGASQWCGLSLSSLKYVVQRTPVFARKRIVSTVFPLECIFSAARRIEAYPGLSGAAKRSTKK
ncbi:MAG: hypothetical protein AAB619_00870, partial [Patescibacteria group bacterium]